MAQSFKICPICNTPSHANAPLCSTCGASLGNVASVMAEQARPVRAPVRYDHRYGETDLFEGELQNRRGTILFGVVLLLAVIVCGAGVFALSPQLVATMMQYTATPSPAPTQLPQNNAPVNDIPLETNTPRPTLQLATVTPAPPTPSPSPTQGPCIQRVQSGDNLIGLAGNCGHRDLIIVTQILEINGLESAESIQVGQDIEIPWPTPTLDPAFVTEEATAEDSVEDDTALVERDGELIPVEQALRASMAIATATDIPGVMLHQVQSGESAVSIALRYGADIEILSQLNPEVTFSQCDFGEISGGPNCIVEIYAGQNLRVPAPTPRPTLSPTPSGSETPTPPPSPTFNAPSLLKPDQRALFARDEIITLRWVTSGTLGEDQAYRIRVEDETAGKVFNDNTREMAFIVPEGWQGEDAARHTYNWSVSVIDEDDPDNPIFSTATRMFTWEGREIPVLPEQEEE